MLSAHMQTLSKPKLRIWFFQHCPHHRIFFFVIWVVASLLHHSSPHLRNAQHPAAHRARHSGHDDAGGGGGEVGGAHSCGWDEARAGEACGSQAHELGVLHTFVRGLLVHEE